jgi:thiosulfate dehydrogenase
MDSHNEFLKLIDRITGALVVAVVISFVVVVWGGVWLSGVLNSPRQHQASQAPVLGKPPWTPPTPSTIPLSAYGDTVRYGRELVVHTASFLGPEGSIDHVTNGMNCQNCHLEGGAKSYGNNFAIVSGSYPKFRARSGTVETLEKRVNDCFERSLNGRALPEESHELKSIVAYIKWVGSSGRPGEIPDGAGLGEIGLLDRKADAERGRQAYAQYCESCHGVNGEGMKTPGEKEFQFPPLWGEHSYNNGAGLYRLSNFARFVHDNMPLGASHENVIISEEEAWDIAAFVNSMPRPEKDLRNDWPDISQKPFDHPFGPYADSFTEDQHKYGPFKPIIESRNTK